MKYQLSISRHSLAQQFDSLEAAKRSAELAAAADGVDWYEVGHAWVGMGDCDCCPDGHPPYPHAVITVADKPSPWDALLGAVMHWKMRHHRVDTRAILAAMQQTESAYTTLEHGPLEDIFNEQRMAAARDNRLQARALGLRLVAQAMLYTLVATEYESPNASLADAIDALIDELKG